MKKETFFSDLTNATFDLLKLARQYSYNSISDHCQYIISEIPKEIQDFESSRKKSNSNNKLKIPVNLHQAIAIITPLYHQLHDINLVIFKADVNLTIIDIRYFSRYSLEEEYRKEVENNPAMLHSKIAYPPYHIDGQKMDINWTTGNLRHKWNMFKLSFKIRKMENEMIQRLNSNR